MITLSPQDIDDLITVALQPPFATAHDPSGVLPQKGVLASLWQARSTEAVAALEKIALVTPAPAVSELAADLLIELSNQLPGAVDSLYRLAVHGDRPTVVASIHNRALEPSTPSLKALLALVEKRRDDYEALDPDFDILTALYCSVPASSPLAERLLNSATQAGLEHWRQIVTASQNLSPEAAAALHTAFIQFQPAERSLAVRLLAAAAPVTPRAVELICSLAMDYEDASARQAALSAGWAPQDAVERALFYFLTEQWQSYQKEDFNHRLIAAAYESASPSLRRRLLALSRYSGQVEWLQSLSIASHSRWLTDMSDADWQAAGKKLIQAENWTDLWRLAQSSPPVWSARFLLVLAQQGWQLPQEEDAPAWKDLLARAERAAGAPLEIQLRKVLRSTEKDITCMALSSDGSRLAAGSSSTAVHFWELPAGAHSINPVMGSSTQARALALSADGAYLAVASGDHRITIYQVAEGRLVKKLDGHNGLIRSLVLPASGRVLYSASFDGTVRAWRFPQGPEIARLEQGGSEWFASAVTTDEKSILSTGANQAVSVRKLPEGSQIWSLTGPSDTLLTLAVAPRGALVAAASRQKDVFLWNYSSGRLLRRIIDLPDAAIALAVHPNEQILIGGFRSGEVILWSISTGQVLHRISAHKAAVASLAVSPDGLTLISAGADGAVCLWNLETFMRTHIPVGAAHLDVIKEIETTLTESPLTAGEKTWLNFTLALMKYRRRYDVEIEESGHVSIGEFDIEISSLSG